MPVAFIFYVGSVFSHWRASMSGFSALLIGAVLQWNPPQWAPESLHWLPVKPDRPLFWWIIAACCFAVAMYQTWKDESADYQFYRSNFVEADATATCH